VAAAVARAARDGAQKTKEMKPKAGRSSYLSTEAVMGILDPGAYAVEVWLGHVQSEF
jgi:triose/dihydroxyacetone kinase / FAD-AMP lyase (cyclizing)